VRGEHLEPRDERKVAETLPWFSGRVMSRLLAPGTVLQLLVRARERHARIDAAVEENRLDASEVEGASHDDFPGGDGPVGEDKRKLSDGGMREVVSDLPGEYSKGIHVIVVQAVP
jgi:hypothetical protein